MIELTLPNGIRDNAGKWTKTVFIDEMIGEDEDILSDQSRLTNGTGTLAVSGPRRITSILSRCTVQIGDEKRPAGKDRYDLPDFFEKAWDLGFSADRMFTMVRLRQMSLGSIYKFKRNCPTCKKEIDNIVIDLSQLTVVPLKLEQVEKFYFSMELPGSRDIIHWKFLQGIDEEFMENTIREHQSDFLSVVLWKRIHKVAPFDAATGQHQSPVDPPGGLLYPKRMKSGDRRYMAVNFDLAEGGIDSDLTIVCNNPSCHMEFTTKLQVIGGDFFFPSETPSLESSTNAPLPSAGGGPLLSSHGSHSANAVE